MDGFVTKAQFATILGTSRAYVSQLVAAKRIVLSDDGKRVHVEPSLKLLNVTSDPSKAGVRERWAAFREGRDMPPADNVVPIRAAAAAPIAPAEQAELLPDDSAADKQQPKPPPAASAYHDARTLREQSLARMAQLDLAKAEGRAVDGESILRAVTDVVVSTRSEIMMFRDRLTPLVTPVTDMRQVYDVIDAECRRLCDNLARRCAALARNEVTA